MPTRRTIVLGTFGAAGALVVGYAFWPSSRIRRANAMDAAKDERFVSNWIKIANDDTVTVVIPHCDMGTGIFTSLSQMAAEELDADWNKVTAETAPSDPLFANGALAEGFILSQQDMSGRDIPPFLRGTVANGFRMVAEYMDLQVTGGSSAVRATGMFGMRLAGAAAREMLLKAAARRWDVDVASCETRSSRVIHKATQREFTYGELAGAASDYEPPTHPRLKDKSEFRLIGRPLQRIDIPGKVDGSTNYGIDVIQPDMLYAAIRISPVFGGKLKSVDTRIVEGRRGIRQVVKLDDAVVVVADRYWRAKAAAADLDPQFDGGGHDKVTSASIAARRLEAVRGRDAKIDLTRGEGIDALARGTSFAATYSVPYLAHSPMEPMNATALYKDGMLEVWSGTQDGLGSRAFCAKAAKLSLDKVAFHLQPMGGGFGRRLPGQWNFLEYAVRTALAVPGVPVKLIFTREQDTQHDYYRPNVTSAFWGSLGPEGLVRTWVNTYTTDDGANPQAHIPYDIPNQQIGSVKVATHVPTGPWRSVEASWHGFFVESFVDELAHRGGQDPFEYRRALLRHAPRHLAVLELAAQKAGWGAPMARGRGRGIAIVESFKTIVAQVAEVTIDAKGALKVDRVVAAVDTGLVVNPDGLKAQIEGAIFFALTAALKGEITIDQGAVAQSNFNDYEMLRLADCPEIEVHLCESDGEVGGAGEPGVPPLAPAVTNAIFAACGVRVRNLPIKNHSLAPSASVTTSE
ncbi:MAG: xanthine dehydrogenase family protein molybdopterin-binding subunit [Alphaproteobacteria bacterium]|nr:xanthine dehydrogenase family protein molybdopterin-binding subunit [Alphaproteobacteria bacterium]MBV9695029.1 xanthine dehydrogenase family protein molybdopterin-binding subunit [Alphaproteobacteria bacterium]